MRIGAAAVPLFDVRSFVSEYVPPRKYSVSPGPSGDAGDRL
jgi:hypothetical protein